jgi:glycosyltransferase involved in cell wall biosynthesis
MEWLFATSLTRAELVASPPPLDRALSDPPRVIYAGRLSAEKGVPILLHALARLRDAGFRALPELVVAGSGPDDAALRALARTLGCDSMVRFTGQLDRAALMAELGAADFSVHAAHSEGYCKAWLDAMAQGLPVLGTEVGAAAAVLGRNGERGWLVPPGSPEAFAEALGHVLTADRDWQALRTRCRAFAEGRTLEAWAEQIERVCSRRWNVAFRAGAILPSRVP